MFPRRPIWLLLTLLLAVLLAACGAAATPEPEPTPTRPLRPTFTPTVIPTDTPEPTATPVPTDTPTPLPTDTPTPVAPKAIVGGDGQVNVRTGPGTAYPEAGQVATGTELDIVASNAAGDWFEVCCVDGQSVWIVARLVEVTGDAGLIQVAQNIPAPPTATPVPTRPPVAVQPPPQPTQPPAPTAPPAPTFPFVKWESPAPRPSTNPWVTFYGLLWNQDLLSAVGEHKLVVQGAGSAEVVCSPDLLWGGGPDDASKFIYTCKAEIPGGPQGVYRVFPTDMAGNQVGEAYEITAQGDMREFFPRWRQN